MLCWTKSRQTDTSVSQKQHFSVMRTADIDHSSRGQRIAKNSLFIYMRMFIIMAVTLYTSRVILQALGFTDFGIYNLVIGIVSFLGFFNVSLANAMQRYLNVGLAKNDLNLTRKYFSQCLCLYGLFMLFILIAGETIGNWFILNKLVIPSERLHAAFWTYQFALINGIVTIIQIPYMAVLIAREKMSVYAYMGLVEVILKLVCVYILLACPQAERLPLYSALVTLSMSIYTIYYIWYCRRFPETRITIVWDKTLIKEIGQFIGATLFGSLAWLIGTQGANVILNLFFGPIVNAARGIALQVSGTINRFTDGVITAIKPQIVQSYTTNEIAYLHSLLHKGSLYAFISMLVLSLPILLNINIILKLWLGEAPEYTGIFTQLIVAEAMLWALQNPLQLAANATGNLKATQITGRILCIASVPVSYCTLLVWKNPIIPFVTLIVTTGCFIVYCLVDIHRQIGLSYGGYLRHVIAPILKLTIPLVFACSLICEFMDETVPRFLLTGTVDVLISALILYFFIMNEAEKHIVKKILYKFKK